MLIPTPSITDLMPDILVESIDEKIGSGHKNRMGYFTRTKKNVSDMNMRKQTKPVENNYLQHTMEGTKGAMPQTIMMAPNIDYTFRGDHVMLNGLDQDMEVNNGTWKP